MKKSKKGKGSRFEYYVPVSARRLRHVIFKHSLVGSIDSPQQQPEYLCTVHRIQLYRKLDNRGRLSFGYVPFNHYSTSKTIRNISLAVNVEFVLRIIITFFGLVRQWGICLTLKSNRLFGHNCVCVFNASKLQCINAWGIGIGEFISALNEKKKKKTKYTMKCDSVRERIGRSRGSCKIV